MNNQWINYLIAQLINYFINQWINCLLLFWHYITVISIAEGEWVEHVLNTGDHTSSMRHRVRWTDYGESDEEGSSRHTTTTVWNQEAAWTVPGRLLQMWGNRPHCTPLPSPYPTAWEFTTKQNNLTLNVSEEKTGWVWFFTANFCLLNVRSLANKSFICQDFIMTNNIDCFYHNRVLD